MTKPLPSVLGSIRRLIRPLPIVVVVLLVLPSAPEAAAAIPALSKPNVVLIFADDLGYADLGCYGAKDIRTPNIDRLAAEGSPFTSFYVGQSVCTASRAALMTGSYPNRVSMSGALNHTSTTGLHPSERLLPQLFKDQGYATATFGKWYNGHNPPFLPTRRGFDGWLGIPYSTANGPLHPVTKGIPSLPFHHNEDVIEVDPDQSRFTQRLAAGAISFIERNHVRGALPTGVKRIANQEYSRPESGALLLDLYLPSKAPDRPLPVVLWIHGGGWKSGSKENCPLTWLAAEGYAVVSLGYRLSGQAQWPAQIDDARAAIRWLRTNAGRLNLDAKRVAVAGGSSGGNLAGVVGTLSAPRGETISSRVNAVIDFYGTSDLLTLPVNVPGPGKTEADLARSNGAKLLGGIPRDRPELARQVSPLHQVSKDDPPFLIIHGDKDDQVPLEQSERLHAKLKEAGVPSEFVVLPGAGHGGKAFDTPAVRQTIRAFLARAMPETAK